MSTIYRKIGYLLAGCLFSSSVWAIVFPITKFDYVYYNAQKKGTNIYALDASKKEPFVIEGYFNCGGIRAYCGTLKFTDVDGSLAEYGLQIDQSCATPDPICKNRGSITADPAKMKKTNFANKEFSVGIQNEGMKEPLIAKFVLSYTQPVKLSLVWDDKFEKSNKILSVYYPSPADPDYATRNSTATLTIKNPSTHKIRIDGLSYDIDALEGSFRSFDMDRLQREIEACKVIFGGDAAKSPGAECQIHFTFINTTDHLGSTPVARKIGLKDFTATDLSDSAAKPQTYHLGRVVTGQDVLTQCPSVNEIKSNWDNLKAHWGIIDPLTNSLTANYDAIRARVEKGEVFFTWYETYPSYRPTKSTDPAFKDSYTNVFLCRYHQTVLLSLHEDLFRTRNNPFYYNGCPSDDHNPASCWFNVGRGLYEKW